MLDGLANAHPAFGRWNKQANTRAAANTLAWIMPPDIEELTQVFEKGRQYKDVPRISWPEMRVSVSAWNGRDPRYGASFSVRPGHFPDSRPFPNSVALSMNAASPGNAVADAIQAALEPLQEMAVPGRDLRDGELTGSPSSRRLAAEQDKTNRKHRCRLRRAPSRSACRLR
jgi:hypothetical protein